MFHKEQITTGINEDCTPVLSPFASSITLSKSESLVFSICQMIDCDSVVSGKDAFEMLVAYLLLVYLIMSIRGNPTEITLFIFTTLFFPS